MLSARVAVVVLLLAWLAPAAGCAILPCNPYTCADIACGFVPTVGTRPPGRLAPTVPPAAPAPRTASGRSLAMGY
jgi:hypothetical protein